VGVKILDLLRALDLDFDFDFDAVFLDVLDTIDVPDGLPLLATLLVLFILRSIIE